MIIIPNIATKTGMQSNGIPMIGVKHSPPCIVIDLEAKTKLMTMTGTSMIAAQTAIVKSPNPCHRFMKAQI
jgi:hypothetical protein